VLEKRRDPLPFGLLARNRLCWLRNFEHFLWAKTWARKFSKSDEGRACQTTAIKRALALINLKAQCYPVDFFCGMFWNNINIGINKQEGNQKKLIKIKVFLNILPKNNN